MIPVAAIIRALINALYSHRKYTCFLLLFNMLLPRKDDRIPLTYRRGSWLYWPNPAFLPSNCVFTVIIHCLGLLECLNLDWNHQEHPQDFCCSYSLKLGWSKCRLIGVWCASIWANKDFSAAEPETPRCCDQSDRIKRPLCSSAIRAQQCQHQCEPCE